MTIGYYFLNFPSALKQGFYYSKKNSLSSSESIIEKETIKIIVKKTIYSMFLTFLILYIENNSIIFVKQEQSKSYNYYIAQKTTKSF